MRRTLVAFVLVLVAVASGPLPASGEAFEGSAVSAGASWDRVRDLRSGGFRVKIWSVYAYIATDGSEALLERVTLRCGRQIRPTGNEARDTANGTKRRRPRCAVEDVRAGFATLPEGAFTIDEAGLTTAHLDTTITTRRLDPRTGRSSGPGTERRVVADWVGHGETSLDTGSFRHEEPGCTLTNEFSDTTRAADATGALDDKALGLTPFGSLTRSTFKATHEGCEDLIVVGPLSARRPPG